jgi:hypothetical protein
MRVERSKFLAKSSSADEMLRKIYSLQQLLSGLLRPLFRRAGDTRVVVALTLAGLVLLGPLTPCGESQDLKGHDFSRAAKRRK